MKKRNLVIGLLVVMALALTSATFAFWASSVNGNNDTATGTITIGQGDAVDSIVSVSDASDGGELVPSGMAAYSTGSPVEYVMLSFSVSWDEDTTNLAPGSASVLSFGYSNVQINSSATYAGLVNISYQIGGTVTGSTLNGDGSTAITLGGADVTVWVLVTLSEPADQTAYNAVAGQDITFTGTFTVA